MMWPDRFSERLHIIAHGENFNVDDLHSLTLPIA